MKPTAKRRTRKPSMFYKLLLPYLAILLATLVMGVTMFYTVGGRYAEETRRLREEQLNQLALELDYYFQYTVDTGDAILFNYKLSSVMQKNQPFYSSEDLRQDLLLVDTHGFLAGMLVYLNNHDVFLTTGIIREAGVYYQNYESLQDVTFEAFSETFLRPYHTRTFLPPQTLRKHAARSTLVIPYVQSAPVRSGSSAYPDAQIILFLDAAPVVRMLEAFAAEHGSALYLVDGEGRAMLQTADAPGLDTWAEAGRGAYPYEGEDYFRFAAGMGSNAARLVLYSPSADLYAGWNAMNQAVGVMIAAFVLIGVLAAVLLAKMNYRPIREINALLSDTDGSDEYERIKNAVIASVTDKQALNGIIERQMPMVKESYLLRLLDSPAFLVGGQDDGLRYPDVSTENRTFYVIMCEFDTQAEYFRQKERVLDENLRSARIILENVGLEVLSQDFEAHYVNTGRTGGTFILSHPAGAPPDGGALEKLRKSSAFVQGFAHSECQLAIGMGISTGWEGVQDLPRCREEARRALEHAMMHQDGITAYADLRPEEVQEHFYYPADVDVRLAGLLRGGSFDEARSLIESLYAENFERRSISLHAGRCFVYEVGTTVDRVLMSLQTGEGEQEALGELLRKLGGRLSFAAARDTTLDYVEKCRALSGLRRQGQTEQLVDRIARYIDENVEQPWLDLGSLAAEFNVTPQYISHIFKKYKDENVKEYISKRRLEEAKRYLRETDLTGEAISLRIGYASEAGLIRLFKKYEAMTPSIYRQASRSAQ